MQFRKYNIRFSEVKNFCTCARFFNHFSHVNKLLNFNYRAVYGKNGSPEIYKVVISRIMTFITTCT